MILAEYEIFVFGRQFPLTGSPIPIYTKTAVYVISLKCLNFHYAGSLILPQNFDSHSSLRVSLHGAKPLARTHAMSVNPPPQLTIFPAIGNDLVRLYVRNASAFSRSQNWIRERSRHRIVLTTAASLEIRAESFSGAFSSIYVNQGSWVSKALVMKHRSNQCNTGMLCLDTESWTQKLKNAP